MNDQNRYRTRAMFKEVCRPEDTPIFSWSNNKDNGYINIKALFIQHTIDDPSEATFAEVVTGDLGWWLEVRESYWIKDHVEQWRRMAAVERKAKAFKAIVKEVEENGRSAFTAAKYLIEEPWVDRRTKTTKKTSQETSEEAYALVNKDAERLQELIKGGL
jgi:hypothetical protein